MFDIGGPELIMIVLGIIILFGPKKIPEIAQMIGKGLQKVRAAQSQFKDQISEIQSELDNVKNPDKFFNINQNKINEIKPDKLREDHLNSINNSAHKVVLPEHESSYIKEVTSTNKSHKIVTDSSELSDKPINPIIDEA